MTDDADPRYSLANERTFLAWIRTALGLLAAAAALVAVDLPWSPLAVRVLALILACSAAFSAVVAWRRWRRVEAAIAAGRSVPPPRSHIVLSVAVTIVAAVVVALVLT